MMANFVAGAEGAEVIGSKCTEEQSYGKDKSCAHKFLEQMTQPSANCRSVIHKQYSPCGAEISPDHSSS